MSLASDDVHRSSMVVLFWTGLLVCICVLGLNVLLDLLDLALIP